MRHFEVDAVEDFDLLCVALGGAAPDFDAAESKGPHDRHAVSVAVVIPARNEADVIGRAIASL
ncbi:MAG TPA: hypothetical protein VGH63_14210, partial [Polyangia bacterium]